MDRYKGSEIRMEHLPPEGRNFITDLNIDNARAAYKVYVGVTKDFEFEIPTWKREITINLIMKIAEETIPCNNRIREYIDFIGTDLL